MASLWRELIEASAIVNKLIETVLKELVDVRARAKPTQQSSLTCSRLFPGQIEADVEKIRIFIKRVFGGTGWPEEGESLDRSHRREIWARCGPGHCKGFGFRSPFHSRENYGRV